MADNIRSLGKYQIRSKVGKGGFATVYLAHDPDLGRDVALKILAPHLSWDSTFSERFRQEARTAAGLYHPNIITIYDIGEDEGQLFLTMPYVQGGSLKEKMEREGALSLQYTVDVLAQIAQALDYAHQHGIVHRDIKPGNILLDTTADGKVRALLSDFGLVKALSRSESLTSTGTILGTPEFMAPEQADSRRRDEVGPRTDIYSLGVVAYYMLTGQVPFSGSTIEVLMSHTNQTPPIPSQIKEDVSEGASVAIMQALEKDAKDRYPIAAAFAESLKQASTHSTLHETASTTPATTTQTDRRVSAPPLWAHTEEAPSSDPEKPHSAGDDIVPAPVHWHDSHQGKQEVELGQSRVPRQTDETPLDTEAEYWIHPEYRTRVIAILLASNLLFLILTYSTGIIGISIHSFTYRFIAVIIASITAIIQLYIIGRYTNSRLNFASKAPTILIAIIAALAVSTILDLFSFVIMPIIHWLVIRDVVKDSRKYLIVTTLGLLVPSIASFLLAILSLVTAVFSFTWLTVMQGVYLRVLRVHEPTSEIS